MRFSAALTAERFLPESLAARARPILARVDGLLFPQTERGAAGQMSLIAFSIRILNAFIAFVSQVLLARWMGVFEYGVFVLVWTAMIIAGNIACLGFQTSIVRFVPEYLARDMLPELRGILMTSRVLVLVASGAAAAVGMLSVWYLSDSIEPYYVVPFFLGMLCLPMIALSDVLQGISRAYSWALSALLPVYLIRPVLILVFMAIAYFGDYGATAIVAVIAAILATYITSLYQFINVTRRVRRGLPRGQSRFLVGEWVAVSLPIFLVESFFFLLTNADVLMVGHFMTPNDVAIYFATVKTLALVHFVYFAVKAGVAQRYASFTHGGERSQLEVFARETVSWTFWPSLAMGVIVLLLGSPILKLFGPGFEAGYPLLFVLVAGVLARAAIGPAESLLTMSGHQKACAVVYGATLAINIGLNFVLIPTFGLWGAAAATAVAVVFEAAALCLTVWRKLGIVMIIFKRVS